MVVKKTVVVCYFLVIFLIIVSSIIVFLTNGVIFRPKEHFSCRNSLWVRCPLLPNSGLNVQILNTDIPVRKNRGINLNSKAFASTPKTYLGRV